MDKKFIFVTGGVVSSLGKGLASASIGCLLESRGFSVNLLKFDPYLNVDPGTMSPYQHGEVYVTDDGAETDLDLGHYERYTHAELTRKNNLTTGRIYETIIQKERRGDYLGKTVQVIPHVTNEIKAAIHRVAESVDITIVEIGGTVGDIESLPFLEAIRQMRQEVGRNNSLFIHLTLVPFIPTAGELKTKPTQHSVKELLEIGIQADILLCRTDRFLSPDMKSKIALFCNVSEHAVITAKDVASVYEVPLVLAAEGLDEEIVRHLQLPKSERHMEDWQSLIDRVHNPIDEVSIGVVGKYVELEDAYKSLREALIHGGLVHNLRTRVHWIEAESLEGNTEPSKLRQFDGILVPGGFGKRGIPGMIRAIQFAREEKIPYFGICLGMQCAVIEYALNVCGLKAANSTEFDANTPYPVIYKLRDLLGIDTIGGTMRLGAYPADLKPSSLARRVYNSEIISERHRHRYEFNRQFEKALTDHGLIISGVSPDKNFVEIVEIEGHPWFLGCQFHPEFKSKPLAPHPLFASFINSSYEHRMTRSKDRFALLDTRSEH
jgi:CTP synthase